MPAEKGKLPDGQFNAPRYQRHLAEFASNRKPQLFLSRCGVPVLGLDLVGREETLHSMQETIEQGRSCHLRAPRRYALLGQTTLITRDGLQSDVPRDS
ncbi:MAG: hypothetical protein AB9873_17215 [Syntrophobacteraceae bacterium]